MESETNQWAAQLQRQKDQQHSPNATRAGVVKVLIAWFKSCKQAISQPFPFVVSSKLQPGECAQDPNGWLYTIHPKTSRLIYADSQTELQKMMQDLASRPAVRRPSPWF